MCSTDSVFSARLELEEAWLPERFGERAIEVQALRAALEPTFEHGDPVIVVLYGPPGQGKATAVRIVADRSKADVDPILIAPGRDSTAYGVVINVVNEFRSASDQLAPGGYAYQNVVDVLERELGSRQGPHLVAVEQLNRMPIDEAERLLETLLTAFGRRPVALVAAVDDLQWRNSITLDLRQRFDEELHFSAYDEGELRTILERRSDRAFFDGAVTASAVDRCVELALDRARDVSFALELLRVAGDEAEGEAQPVTEVDVEWARDVVEQVHLEDRLREHTIHQRLALKALVELASMQALPARIREVSDAYVTACARVDLDPNCKRALQSYLKDLIEEGVVTATERRTDRGGRYYVYDLVPKPGLLEQVIDPLDDSGV